MQKITLIVVGKLKERFYIEAQSEYLKRLTNTCDFSLVEISEQKLSDAPNASEIEKSLAMEAKNIEEKIPKGSTLIALCVEGTQLDSVALSQKLQTYANMGKSSITFLIGSSFGLHESLKQKANFKLSMSPMTFPHHLARIMLLEQIYRAYQINLGTKYHK